MEQPSLSHKDFIKKPLDERETINKYIQDISARYNIEPELIMSIVQQESDYNPKAKNGKCLGLMQVSTYWHDDRAARLGVTDFYDPYGNILLGVDYLSELLKQYKDKTLVLMLYSMDHDTAFKMYKNGQISSYAKTVIARAEKYKKGE
jgi:soluble lytic murein transglycosylase-like protein